MAGTLPHNRVGVVGSPLLQNTPPRRSPRGRSVPARASGTAHANGIGRAGGADVDVGASARSDTASSTRSDDSDDARVGAFVIGVTGASASGKTTVCSKIMDGLADQRCALVCLDWFYHGLMPGTRAEEYNFDHPDAFDYDALRETLELMQCGCPVSVPRYDFASHRRDPANATTIGTVDVVIVEGILSCYDPTIRAMMNMKIFVDEDADVCLVRRLRRDVRDRGRSVESVLVQYERFVKPSYEGHILPTKRYADIVVPRGGENMVAVDLIVKHCALKIRQVDLRKLHPNLVIMADSYQVRGLHTLFRDAKASRHDFVFYADRLMRLLIEEGLGLLPFERKSVVTPLGATYNGVGFCTGICGVVLMPGGEAMENSLRAVCANIRVGKMLIVAPTKEARRVSYAKLPGDIGDRTVLLLDPVLNTGLGCITAIEHLLAEDVACTEERILVFAVIASRSAVKDICTRFPKARLVVSAVDGSVDQSGRVVPGVGDFATRYFGYC